MPRFSFITATEVAAARGYDGSTDWGAHEQATITTDSVASFGSMLDRIKAAGFDAIDLWSAHCRWDTHAGTEYARAVPQLCRQKGLAILSYAGGLMIEKPEQCQAPLVFMKSLGIGMWAGGIWGMEAINAMPAISAACETLGVRYALENHPEKTLDELLAKIGHGKFSHIGIALDTGWCATQGMDYIDAIHRLGSQLMIIHLKDVRAAGTHNSCALGDGIVDFPGVLAALKEVGYTGDICIEHEPFDRDPLPEMVTSLKRLKAWLGSTPV